MTGREALLATVVALLAAVARLSVHVWSVTAEGRQSASKLPSLSRAAVVRGYPLLAVVAVLTPWVVSSGVAVLRPAVGLVFVLLVPGAALLGYVAIRDPLDHLVLAVVTSLVAIAATSLAMLYAHVWRPDLLAATFAIPSAWALTRHAITSSPPVTRDHGSAWEGR